MDEDEDSDVETTRVSEGASGQVPDSSMETTDGAVLQSRQLNSGEHYADLDSVNFTWLKDFFASSWVNFVVANIRCRICAWIKRNNYFIKDKWKWKIKTIQFPQCRVSSRKNAPQMKDNHELSGREM